MNKPIQEKVNRLLNQYKALTVERLEVENVICRNYEVLMINEPENSAEKLEEIKILKKRLSHINKEIMNTDKKILKLLKPSNGK